MRRSAVARWLLATLVPLGMVLFLFETNPWDIALQDHFYNRARADWIVDRTEPIARWTFYEAPKYVIAVVAFSVLGLALGPERWRKRCAFARRDLWVAFLTLLTVPLIVGQLKDMTNVFLPRQIRRYGGDVPYVRVFERYPANDQPARRGKGFPAGHASGGFALIGLLWLRRSRRWRGGAVAAALLAGWAMGTYQMLNGSHFLSHTITTMFLAAIITLLWRLCLPAQPPAGRPGTVDCIPGESTGPKRSSRVTEDTEGAQRPRSVASFSGNSSPHLDGEPISDS